MSPATDMLTFLGTAGARLMVASQILASGGLWLELGGTQILLDPGPGTLVQATKRKLRASKLDAIVLSHRHLDHSADANVMIEAMTDGGLRRRGTLFAPRDALEDDPVVLHYLRSYLDNIEILEAGKSYNIGEVTLKDPHQAPPRRGDLWGDFRQPEAYHLLHRGHPLFPGAMFSLSGRPCYCERGQAGVRSSLRPPLGA
ncbi:Ribonuclease BN [subsurface metagenome]